MVYALALGQLLTGIVALVRTRKQIVWFPAHVLWVTALFAAILITWWTSWIFRDVEWTLPKYLYMAITPVLMFVCTSLINPDDAQEETINLQEHFLSIRRVFLLCFLFTALSTYIDSTVLLGAPFWYPERALHAVLLSAVLAGLFTERKNLHTLFAATVVVVNLIAVAGNFWQQG